MYEKWVLWNSRKMYNRGFSSDWRCYFVEIPRITQGLPRCNAARSDRLLLYHFLQIKKCVLRFTRVFSDKFLNSKSYQYACDLSIDLNHNVYSNNCSLLYFGHFLAVNILSINLACRELWNTTSDESFHSTVLSEIDLMHSAKESGKKKDAQCTFCNEKYSEDERGKKLD